MNGCTVLKEVISDSNNILIKPMWVRGEMKQNIFLHAVKINCYQIKTYCYNYERLYINHIVIF